jgi:hypothetical protein
MDRRWFGLLVVVLFESTSLFGQRDGGGRGVFVDYFFENASRVTWEMQGDSIMRIALLPDYERSGLNRQTTHCYFRLVGAPGSHAKFLLTKSLSGFYNGKETPRTRSWSTEYDNPLYVSYDQKEWTPVKTEKVGGGTDLLVDVDLGRGGSVYVADLPPYTLSDLEHFEERIKESGSVKILNIGKTSENRPLEVIQLGSSEAPNVFLIRARAHAWESGGNYVAEGLVSEFIANADKWEKTFCVYILPMANKDGVARGMTRFTVMGMDLNRDWGAEPDARLCPENYALEYFIKGLLKKGITPLLAIDLHNDSYGGLMLGQVSEADRDFMKRIKTFEELMRRFTSFSEKLKFTTTTAARPESAGKFQFNDGLRRRFGIDAVVYELNAHWIGSLKKIPSATDFKNVGRDLNTVFYEYSRLLAKRP